VSSITLRQPLFNYDSFVRYQQGGVQAAHSDAIFDRKEAELAVKVSAAYFEILLATEKLALTDAEMAAYRAQRELAERRRKSGEGTVTEVAEAESRLQLARAGRADALDSLAVATLRLESMTGKPVQPLWILRPEFTPISKNGRCWRRTIAPRFVPGARRGSFPVWTSIAIAPVITRNSISWRGRRGRRTKRFRRSTRKVRSIPSAYRSISHCLRAAGSIGTHRSGGGQPRAGAGRTRCRHQTGCMIEVKRQFHGRPDR
jgi:hypothetical protein